jgi:magnesium chelatase family protein
MEVPPVPFKDLAVNDEGQTSAEVLKRVKMAREIQANRFQRTRIHTNANMTSRQIRKFCQLDSDSNELLEKAMDRFGLSARAHSRVLKIARTIADLEGVQDIRASDIAEAIQYRSLDRRLHR